LISVREGKIRIYLGKVPVVGDEGENYKNKCEYKVGGTKRVNNLFAAESLKNPGYPLPCIVPFIYSVFNTGYHLDQAYT
jgi:hypothetical protein